MKRSLHWFQRQTRLSSALLPPLLLPLPPDADDCVVADEADEPGTGVPLLEPDEWLAPSCTDDMVERDDTTGEPIVDR